MISYVYFKESKIIITKIDNIEFISVSDKQIKGDSEIRYGDSQDYIILQEDSINLNKNDTIDLTGLVDCRNYFINKDAWYQEQIKSANDTISSQQTTIEDLNSDNLNSMLAITELYELILSSSTTS